MSDTPRTSEAQYGTGRVSVEFARQLERELNAANERIKRLEEAGDDMYGYINHSHSSVSSIEVYNVLTNWAKAKENKP